MLKLLKVAITGGIASGKSTVCQLFQELGAYVISADDIVHELLDPQTDLGQKIIRLFGSDIVQNGKIARPVIAKKVFNDPKLLKKLEELIHPEVLKQIERLYQQACTQEKQVPFIVEMPLLFEIGAESAYDKTIALVTPIETARRRWIDAGHSNQDFELRTNRQIPNDAKQKQADYIIQNNGTLQDLRRQVKELYHIFTTAS